MWEARRREKKLKEKLLEVLEASGVDPTLISEWVWEEFGKRVKPEWKSIRRVLLSEQEITAQDLISLIDELGLTDRLDKLNLEGEAGWES